MELSLKQSDFLGSLTYHYVFFEKPIPPVFELTFTVSRHVRILTKRYIMNHQNSINISIAKFTSTIAEYLVKR